MITSGNRFWTPRRGMVPLNFSLDPSCAQSLKQRWSVRRRRVQLRHAQPTWGTRIPTTPFCAAQEHHVPRSAPQPKKSCIIMYNTWSSVVAIERPMPAAFPLCIAKSVTNCERAQPVPVLRACEMFSFCIYNSCTI